ncbi:transposase [Ectothiorhodospiraceae bacterium BW-2]|nr:transposase [Ectothiorhodospiraceae bacterium BW-2]
MSHSDYLVQELLMEVNVICYRREVWRRPDGSLAIGELPDDVKGHFGPTLKSYLLYQNHHGCMTQPRIHQQLTEIGFQLSTGQLSQLLTEGHDAFHEEALSVLQAGIDVCDYLQTDDTGARHDGKNGYCTVITNDLFTWFGSTESKSRINFLTLLQAGECRYVLNSEALTYMSGQKFPQKKQEQLKLGQTFTDRDSWHIHLRKVGITNQRHIRIVTEGALLGGLVDLGFDTNIALISDDAGQFNLFYHALCWIHAERVDELCRTKTSYMLMNNALSRLAANKTELFRVLERPDIPLHNNLSEREIREYVTRRKISGSTRSENGRRCRDTFTSLKKTCRKLGISFWDYLNDRISGANKLIPLADAIRNAAVANG